MNTKQLKLLRIAVAILNGTMEITSLIYNGISLYYTIHHNFTTAGMYIGLSVMLGIVFLISCNLYDAIVEEIEDRKQSRQKKILRLEVIKK